MRAARRFRSPAALSALSVVAALAAAACASAPKAPTTTPSAQTTRVEERDQTLEGFVAEVEVLVKNPTAAPVEVKGAKYELLVDKQLADKGDAEVKAQVGPGEEKPVLVRVPYTYAKSDTELASLAERKEPIDYVVRGTLATSGGNLEFAHHAEVRAPRLLTLKLENIEAITSPSQGLTVTATVEVANPNPFAVPLKGLSWKLQLVDKPTAEGTVGRHDVAKPASQLQYELEAHLDNDELKQRKDIPLGGPIPYALDVDLDIGLARISMPKDTGLARVAKNPE